MTAHVTRLVAQRVAPCPLRADMAVVGTLGALLIDHGSRIDRLGHAAALEAAYVDPHVLAAADAAGLPVADVVGWLDQQDAAS
jgi:hypothetical protein